MFTLDDKKYDENKISENGKAALARLQQINTDQNKIKLKFEDNTILIKHYMAILQKEIKSNEEKANT